MAVAIWIIAICVWLIADCEIVRLVQNAHQLRMLAENHKGYDDACKAFVESLKDDDRERVRKLLEELDKAETVTTEHVDDDDGVNVWKPDGVERTSETGLPCQWCGGTMRKVATIQRDEVTTTTQWHCPQCKNDFYLWSIGSAGRKEEGGEQDE